MANSSRTPVKHSGSSVTLGSINNSVIGIGINHPIAFGNQGKNTLLRTVTGVDCINQSIYIILETRRGSRHNNNEFGSDIKNLIFEPNDVILQSILYYSIMDSLARWEKRIMVISITIDTLDSTTTYPGSGSTSSVTGEAINPAMDPNQVNVTITYKIIGTSTIGSYVYPFYRQAMPASEIIHGHESVGLSTAQLRGY